MNIELFSQLKQNIFFNIVLLISNKENANEVANDNYC